MTTHAHSSPTACSVQWEDAELPAWGTASQAQFWVALEQPGPWGREAALDSHLVPDLGHALTTACADAGGRLLLVREPGRHADVHAEPGSRVWIAGGLAREPWLVEGEIDDPTDLLRLPWSDLVGTEPDRVEAAVPGLEETREPLLLVCTNGRRDLCCAVRGRPVALEAAERLPARVLECSHTGGHRFAPTGIMLPSGQTWARLDADLAVLAFEAERQGRLPAELSTAAHDRGRSCLSPAAQAAESWVRQAVGELGLTALRTPPDAGEGVVEVTRGEEVWQVRVTRVEGASLPDSCVKPPKPSITWQAGPA
ncbi:sucrase ferredoxin [Luteipulveratus sp. YIM 133132]|uniref:Sucrase ferredoxin n=1 Tax=Luteipulveratus flavus TaxID=3031728 RepID=A0ABT6CA86_9MICO|nr:MULTISPECIES: sucrase ferredoxin [unclassified Luteipulveratus]MDE9366786.1 sucrase ferredoxin [Luteipulveratus sp. YIM 133132]MDF8265819.1 sucrase ferredoxin [Luteipulveratus sp. YIM 133296]